MARPRVDGDAIKNTIVEIAETLLVETSGQRLVLSDIAQRLGVSQPYIHRYFKSKNDLLAELARRWFEKVEATGQEICESEQTWSEKLRNHILQTMLLKKSAYESNPRLFSAYLTIASSHREIVALHTQALADQLKTILSIAVGKEDLPTILELVLDATVQFRVPVAIVNAPNHATPERANRVLDALIGFIEKNQQ